MKNIAFALLAATVSCSMLACAEPASEEAGSDEAAYSFFDPPRAVLVDAGTVHLECTNAHGALAVVTFEDRIFTAKVPWGMSTCQTRRDELAARTTPLSGSLLEERGAIRRGKLDLEGGLALESWGD